jgi:ABC-type amino acid transport substrate-binding protein
MVKWVIGMMAGVVLFATVPVAAPAGVLIVGSPEWIPWQIIKGEQVTGISIDILEALDRRIDPTLEFKPLPHKRMMVAFKSQQIAAEPSVNPLWRADQRDIPVYTIQALEAVSPAS